MQDARERPASWFARCARQPEGSRVSAAAHRPDFGPSSDSLAIYLREIGAYHLLTRPEESALAARVRGGDQAALEALICANLRFVVSIAKLYQNRGVSLSDLINEGRFRCAAPARSRARPAHARPRVGA